MSKEEEKTVEEEEEEKTEEVASTLEDLSEAVEEEIESKDPALGKLSRKKPVAVLLESPQVLRDLAKLPKMYLKDPRILEAAEEQLERTQKNIIIFYQHAAGIGERLRGLLYLLLGLSIFSAGIVASQVDTFTLADFLYYLAATGIGQILVVVVGVCFMAYGSSKMFRGLKDKIDEAKAKRQKPKYVQKKLSY